MRPDPTKPGVHIPVRIHAEAYQVEPDVTRDREEEAPCLGDWKSASAFLPESVAVATLLADFFFMQLLNYLSSNGRI